MPTYLYECPIHGEFEHQHSINEELKFCPKCQDECEHLDLSKEEKRAPCQVKKLIASGTNFILVGGGWAKDNYH